MSLGGDVTAVAAERAGLRIVAGGGPRWMASAEEWFERSSADAIHTRVPNRYAPSAHELLWLAMARESARTHGRASGAVERPPGCTAAQSRAGVRRLLRKLGMPAAFAFTVNSVASQPVQPGEGDFTAARALIHKMEVSILASLWVSESQVLGNTPCDYPIAAVADCTRFFYWLRVFARAACCGVRHAGGGVFETDAAKALALLMTNRAANNNIEGLATPWVTRYQGAIDMERGYTRCATSAMTVDNSSLLRDIIDDDAEYARAIEHIKHNPGVRANASGEAGLVPGPLSADEMSIWFMAAWCNAFSQVCRRPRGVPPSFDMFSQWYFVSFGDIGSERHRVVAAFKERRNGAAPRPFICHAGSGLWFVFSPSARAVRCDTAVDAIAAWVRAVHESFGGILETGQKIGTSAAWFF